ncbi:MAG: hypothetical protein J07HX64_01898 [halophilic archaeon J07HX64]|nr:MAG: hypothetical protein J07HX64_01898 [halophilic archaeon J07HX64]
MHRAGGVLGTDVGGLCPGALLALVAGIISHGRSLSGNNRPATDTNGE